MDSLSLKVLLGAAGAGGSTMYGYEVQDTNAIGTNQNIYFRADDLGNVYGCIKDGTKYLKIGSAGTIDWQYFMFSGYEVFNEICPSPNGTYLAICGRGGPTGAYNFGSVGLISELNPSTGYPTGTYFGSTSTSSNNQKIGYANGLEVTNAGYAVMAGANRVALSSAPYNDFTALFGNLSTGSFIKNDGKTNLPYFEAWQTVSANDSFALFTGFNQNSPISGYSNTCAATYATNSGTLQAQTNWNSSGTYNQFNLNDVALHPTGSGGFVVGSHTGTNTIGVWNYYFGSFSNPVNIRYSTNNDIQWYRVTTDGTIAYCYGASSAITGSQVIVIAAVDTTTASVLWANYFSHSAGGLNYTDIQYNATLDILGTCFYPAHGQAKAAWFAVPTNGSGAGTYGDYTYTPVTLTSNSGSLSLVQGNTYPVGYWVDTTPSFTPGTYSAYTVTSL